MEDQLKRITMGHGGGGRLTQELIDQIIVPILGPKDGVMHDAALVTMCGQQLAFSTDSYVVRPIHFPGGDIGELAVTGSINDLAMAGASPIALSLALIIEEGFGIKYLVEVLNSIRKTCTSIGVNVITGDTKVVERGCGDGLYINTTAIGHVAHSLKISPRAICPGDAVLVSGDLGRHGLAVLSARAELGLRSTLKSDLACLLAPVKALIAAGIEIHCLRDLTRGGLLSACDEIGRSARCTMRLTEELIPVHPSVKAASEVLGIDPLAMANEGRMLVICPEQHASMALSILQTYREEAARIGTVGQRAMHKSLDERYPISLLTELGVNHPVILSNGEDAPRIC
jgi:hydrogenase expression/formation protein HypE